jgi:cell division protease FtsH
LLAATGCVTTQYDFDPYRQPPEAMTVTNDEQTSPPADTVGGADPGRHPITDVGAYLDSLPEDARAGLRALGDLLVGVTQRPPRAETADRFTARCLGVATVGQLVDEERELDPVSRLTTAVALAEWITSHVNVTEVGPGEYALPPAWTQTEIGGRAYRHPQCLRVHFPAGTVLADTGCVIGIDARRSGMGSPDISAYVTRDHQNGARLALDRLADRAKDLNPYRGRAVRATNVGGLHLSVIDLPSRLTRDTVIIDDEVWREIDLGLTAVRDRHDLLNTHGLGARRGVLLCGPPGTGKSAVSAVIAAEVAGAFTVIYVEAKAGEHLLTAVVQEAQRLGGPVLLVLEDVDLWCQSRHSGYGGGLSELLAAMDIAADARILTLASTNDAATLDEAAIRTGRFDAIVGVGYPTRTDAASILTALIAGLPGAGAVDTHAVAAAVPEQTSGSDLREIVRRAVLSADETGLLSTATLLAEVGSGRYRATIPNGMYL